MKKGGALKHLELIFARGLREEPGGEGGGTAVEKYEMEGAKTMTHT